CKPDRGVEFGAADLEVEAIRLLESLEVWRAQANHRFTKGDDIERHGSLRLCTVVPIIGTVRLHIGKERQRNPRDRESPPGRSYRASVDPTENWILTLTGN